VCQYQSVSDGCRAAAGCPWIPAGGAVRGTGGDQGHRREWRPSRSNTSVPYIAEALSPLPMYRGPRLRSWLVVAGYDEIRARSTIIERWAPLRTAEAHYCIDLWLSELDVPLAAILRLLEARGRVYAAIYAETEVVISHR
jgi:hypothetical protein